MLEIEHLKHRGLVRVRTLRSARPQGLLYVLSCTAVGIVVFNAVMRWVQGW